MSAGRVALLSDVHGNLPAFETVLEAIGAAGIDEVWCLGDLVGYGPHPNQCVALAREACDLNLVGNHDLVVLDRIDISVFSGLAARAATWTRRELAEDAAQWLGELSPDRTDGAVGLFHASPRDPVWEYVLSSGAARLCLDAMDARVGAIGHSHVALFFHREDGGVTMGDVAPAGTEHDIGAGRWLLNPGGVGQPRDGDPRAAWLELDTERWTATWHRVEYDIERTARAILEAGLPSVLAERLFEGR